MSGDSVPLILPLSRFPSKACEATTLYRELRKPLLRYLVCLGLSPDEEQDVVQDAFLTLHRQVAAGGSQENIRGWLFRVAHNQARNRQNRYERRFAAPLEENIDVVLDQSHGHFRHWRIHPVQQPQFERQRHLSKPLRWAIWRKPARDVIDRVILRCNRPTR